MSDINLNIRSHTIHIDEIMPVIRERLKCGQSVCFSPRGVSMLPMLQQGRDTVTLSAIDRDLKKYDIGLYQRENGSYVLHRIVRVGESYTCIGDNQFVFEKGVLPRQFLAVVTEFTHNGKEYSVSDFRYRLYCQFWNMSRFTRRCIRAFKTRVIRQIKR